MRDNSISGQHVAQINVDVEQVDLVHDFASLTNGLARDDDMVVVGGIAAGGIDTVTGADATDDERIDLQRGQNGVQVGGVEGAGVFFAHNFLALTST